jgi:hypothetical protein
MDARVDARTPPDEFMDFLPALLSGVRIILAARAGRAVRRARRNPELDHSYRGFAKPLALETRAHATKE